MGVAALLWQASAYAQAGTHSEDRTRFVVIFLTVLVALLIGLLLYALAQRSSQVKLKEKADEPFVASGRDKSASADATPDVIAAINRLPVSAAQRQQVARLVSEIVNKTVTQRVEVVTKEIGGQYTKLIEEQRRDKAVLQNKYQEALVEQKRTAAVLESIAEGLVVVNNKGEVVMMNPAAEKLLAVNQKDRIGKPLTEGLRDEQFISLAQGSSMEEREIVLNATQDSTKRVLRASNAVITDEDGRTVGMVAVLSDVTKQREIDQLKSEFVSKVSHELRTPIVAMQHALSILIDEVAGPLTEEQKTFATLTQRNLQRLNVLINDFLDLSKLEAKKMELRIEPTELGPA